MPAEGHLAGIFLSYAREDRGCAEKLAQTLEQAPPPRISFAPTRSMSRSSRSRSPKAVSAAICPCFPPAPQEQSWARRGGAPAIPSSPTRRCSRATISASPAALRPPAARKSGNCSAKRASPCSPTSPSRAICRPSSACANRATTALARPGPTRRSATGRRSAACASAAATSARCARRRLRFARDSKGTSRDSLRSWTSRRPTYPLSGFAASIGSSTIGATSLGDCSGNATARKST